MLSRRKLLKLSAISFGGLLAPYRLQKEIQLGRKLVASPRSAQNLEIQQLNILIPGWLDLESPWVKLFKGGAQEFLKAEANGYFKINFFRDPSEIYSAGGRIDGFIGNPSLWRDGTLHYLGNLDASTLGSSRHSWYTDELFKKLWAQANREHGMESYPIAIGSGHTGLVSGAADLDTDRLNAYRFAAARRGSKEILREMGANVVDIGAQQIVSSIIDSNVDFSEVQSHKFWLKSGLLKDERLFYVPNNWRGVEIFDIKVSLASVAGLTERNRTRLAQMSELLLPKTSQLFNDEIEANFDQVKNIVGGRVRSQDAFFNKYALARKKVVIGACPSGCAVRKIFDYFDEGQKTQSLL